MQNYFELFDLKTSFFVDDNALKKAYQAQVTRFHPDNFATKKPSGTTPSATKHFTCEFCLYST